MKKKTMAMALGIILCISPLTSLPVCAEAKPAMEFGAEENTIIGELTAIEGSKITINAVTPADDSNSAEKTGETLTFEISADTQITHGGMFGGAGAPEKPNGEPPAMGKDAPKKPNGTPPSGDDAPQQALTIDDLHVGDIVALTLNDDGTAATILLQTGGMGMPGSNGAEVIYGGSTEITAAAEEDGQTYASDTADQSALYISTAEDVHISGATVTKSGDSDGGDNCNFYGQNAAVLVKDGATATISGTTVTSDANGANGVFSYGGNAGQNLTEGDGTTVVIQDSTITTTGDGAGGIMTAGGGITNASNLTVETFGRSSAAIRSDRGGGTVTADGGTYTTNGLGSPAIYSTADITVSNATLLSNLSEGVCIEGLNSITLNDCNLTANNTGLNGNATFHDAIMIYQSMSGDAANGTSSFTMRGGSLTCENGHVFHVTNTDAIITLDGVQVTNNSEGNVLLSVCDDGWSGGDNIAEVNASNQALDGAILVGSNSTLTLNLAENSAFTGYIDGKIENAKGETVSTEVGTVCVTLDASSTWTLTADSRIAQFNGDASCIISNGHTLYVNGEALQGTN